MTNTNTSVVRKLKHDINQKNTIRRNIEKRTRSVCLWKDKLANSKCFQKQRQYSASIKRYLAEIESLSDRLNQMNEDLDKRIREAGKCSIPEIEEFQSQLEQKIGDIESDKDLKKTKVSHSKDIEEIRNARKKLAELKGEANLQKKIEKANKQLAEDIAEVERVTGRIMKLRSPLGKISKGVGVEEKELTQEEKDKNMFTQELKCISSERLIFSSKS